MQSIRLCLGEASKIDGHTELAIQKIREAYMCMSYVAVQFGDLKVEGLLYSYTLSREPVGRKDMAYLECQFMSLEEVYR